MWERFTIKKVWARTVLEDAARVTQLGTNGRWQHETPYKEKLELLRHSTDLRCGGSPMRKANNAGKSSDWEMFVEDGKLSAMSKCEGERMLQ